MKRFLKSSFLFLSLLAAPAAMATHLVGGNLGYVYLGETFPGSQVYRYGVTMEFYMNCGPNSNFQTFAELLDQSPNGTLPVGVYLQDPQNPDADKNQQATVELSLISQEQIIPDFPDGCTVGDGLCTLRGVFAGTVDLPLSFSGYHLYFQMCCRNLDIDNLENPNGTGIGYYAFIPPTLVNNSSPVFLGIPTPFLCISDTTTFINTASDPDGDQLIFSFETPYNSVSQQGGVQPPPNQLPWPVPEVTWAAGFNTVQPFGPGGYAFLNGATGLTEYQPPLQGNYVIAVEIKEYRNGQLIGRTRRDLQLQAIPCPPNNTPQVSGNLPTSYTVNAGDQLCFDMSFLDLDTDSITLNASGTIFNGTLFDPPATIDSAITGNGTVSSQFCWNTACDQGQDQPYLFSVSVIDNGCPPKSVDVVFQVNVIPFAGPQIIAGPGQVCTQQSGSTYTTPAIAGATFAWTVNGGVIVTGQGTNTITVDWGASGAGSVLVSATNALGCVSEPVSVSVNIVPLPAANAGADVTLCAGGTTPLGGAPTGPNGSSFTWSPSATLNSSSAANPVATPVATTSYVVQVSNGGCVNTDTVLVVISQPVVDAGDNAAICAGGSTQLQASGNGTFLWSPANGLSATDIASPVAQPAITTMYTVTLSDSVNCTAVDSVLVTVNPLPTVDAGADTSACINEQITLGGSPTGPTGSTYSWSPAAGLNNITVANPLATIAGTATYTVTVTDGNTCVASDSVTINALAIPDVDAGPDTSICAGQSVQLNGSGNGTLVWSPIFGLSDPNIPNPTANPEATTIYTLTVTGGNLCTNTDQTTVTVNVLPNANAGPDLSVCLGDSVQIQATGPGTYAWTPAATLSNPNIPNPYASPVVNTMYTMTLTDDQACSRSDSMMVFVVQPSNAGTDGSTSICGAAFPLTLFNLLGGNPPVGGTWVAPDGSPSTGEYTPGASLPGPYAYVIAGTTPCPNDTAFVTVTETPAADAGESTSLQLCSNSSPVDLFTALGGTPQAGGQWTDSNGQPSSGIFDPSVSGSDVLTYVVSAVLPCTDDEASVTIVVNAALDPGVGGTLSTCASGLIFNLTDSLGGAPDPNGVWLDPDGVQHGALFSPAIDPAGAWTYFIAGGNGCADTSAILNIVVTTPNTEILGDNEICIGDTTQLSNAGNVSHLWFPATGVSDPANNAPLFYPSSTTTYSLTVTDAAGCIGTDSVVVTVNELPSVDAGQPVGVCVGASTPIGGTPTGPTGSTYQWTPASGLDNTTAANPVAQPAITSTYTVFITDVNQCSASDSVTVTVNQLPLLEAGTDTSFCQGGSVQLNATGLGTFLWSPSTGLNSVDVANPIASPGTTTSYSVTLTDANNCSSNDALTVTVLGLPNANAGEDQYLCPGFGVQLNGAGGGSANWSPDATLDNANILNPVASPVVTTTYTLVITDGNGCTGSDDVLVNVSTDPPADAGPDQSVCQGDQVTLGGNPTNIPGTSVLWSPSTDLSDATASNPVSTPTANTLYTVTVTSDTCTSQDVVLVNLQGIAEAAFTMRLEPGCDELRAFFTDQSSGAAQWAWDFGDGTTSTEQNPQHLFTYGQPITVTLVVTDNFGCTGTITQTFQTSNFDDFVDYQIPNVFTPNGDGKNDVFTVNTNGFLGPCVNLQVFNRWGQKMFESFGNDITWTGRNIAGEPCVSGTYFYTLTLKDMSFNGNVYLNR